MTYRKFFGGAAALSILVTACSEAPVEVSSFEPIAPSFSYTTFDPPT
jgi:hypothetical protein